jgi:hypothetical protein
MKMILRPLATALAGLCVASFSSQAAAAEGDGWSWMVAPYIWAAGVSTNHKRDVPPSESSNSTNFKNIVDKIDGAFMLHAEGQGDHIGVFADYLYLGLGDKHDFDLLSTDSQLDATLFDLAMVWSPGDQRYTGFELFGGLRYINVDLSIDFKPNNPALPTVNVDPGETYNDFLLGFRYKWDLSDRWGLSIRVDGSTGDTDGTFNTAANFMYNTEHGAWVFGYRYMTADLPSKFSSTDLTMDGPQFGYAFKF